MRRAGGKMIVKGTSFRSAKLPQVPDSQLDGVVAQLVERLVRNEKVRGSTPLGSTIQFPRKAPCFLGGHEFPDESRLPTKPAYLFPSLSKAVFYSRRKWISTTNVDEDWPLFLAVVRKGESTHRGRTGRNRRKFSLDKSSTTDSLKRSKTDKIAFNSRCGALAAWENWVIIRVAVRKCEAGVVNQFDLIHQPACLVCEPASQLFHPQTGCF